MSNIFWNVVTNGDWDDAANWSPETVPGVGDDAVLGAIGFAIAQPYTVTVTASINVDDVVISDANAVLLDSGPVTVTIADDLTNGGFLNVESGGLTTVEGAVNNTGTIDVNTEGGGAPTTANFATLDNTGTINITGGSSTL